MHAKNECFTVTIHCSTDNHVSETYCFTVQHYRALTESQLRVYGRRIFLTQTSQI